MNEKGNKKMYFSGLRFLENVYLGLQDLQPDTHKIRMMIFTSDVDQTKKTFREYMEEYLTIDLLQIKSWSDNKEEAILICDNVDEVFE